MKQSRWLILCTVTVALQVGCAQPLVPPDTQIPSPTKSPPGEPTLITGALGSTEEVVPTNAEIKVANDQLHAKNAFVSIIPATLSTEYFYTVTRAARQRAEDLGMQVEVQDAHTDAETQSRIIHDAVDRGAAVIVLDLFTLDGVQEAIKYAQDHHVFLVQFAGRQAAEYGAVTISVEDEDLGAAAGGYAAELINRELGGKANVVILDYPDAPSVVVRAEAIRKELKAVAPDAVILGSYKGGTTEFGLTAMQNALAEHPDLNVVVSINDAGAYGAFQVLEAAGRTRVDTIIIGIDGEDQARQYINQKTMYRGTVDTSPALTGETAINAVVKLLAGAALPQNIRIPVQLVMSQDGQ